MAPSFLHLERLDETQSLLQKLLVMVCCKQNNKKPGWSLHIIILISDDQNALSMGAICWTGALRQVLPQNYTNNMEIKT